MTKTQTFPWDAAEYLETREDMAAYLEAALEEGDSALVIAALKDIARSQGITHLTKETGLDYESLHQALSSEENPEFGTVLKVIQALGLKLQATPM
ncbi:MAG: putative addiction module antidote protein [Cyanobacteria bacterium]|jgi:probable addiction module antidote protein|nr:putative addiction module antidote protein [Cyanobacteria bacterium GSL.Bin1]